MTAAALAGRPAGAAAAAPAARRQRTPPPPAPAAASADRRARRHAGGAADFGSVHASPSVRRLARELERRPDQASRAPARRAGSPRTTCRASCAGRRPAPAAAAPAGGMGIPEIPAEDFSKFGPIETKPLPRIKKLSGPHLHRAWLNVPHVTHNDEADITELDAYRKELDSAAKDKGYRVTLLAFLMKACVSALKRVPGVQQLAVAGEGQPDPQEILQHRHRRRHAGRAGRAGHQGRRPQGHHRAEPGARRRLEEGARRQAVAGRHAGRHASPSPASAASAAPASRRSSTRPRWRSSAWCARRWRRSGTARSSCPG